jgi:hypothetical protein
MPGFDFRSGGFMRDVLFINDGGRSRALVDVASDVFLSLGIVSTEERESSHYIDGHYFIGYSKNVAVVVCHSDGDPAEFPYWVVLREPMLGRGDDVLLRADCSGVATTLAENRFSVFVPSAGWARADWDGEGVRYGEAGGSA